MLVRDFEGSEEAVQAALKFQVLGVERHGFWQLQMLQKAVYKSAVSNASIEQCLYFRRARKWVALDTS